jgi:hypothetical protein
MIKLYVSIILISIMLSTPLIAEDMTSTFSLPSGIEVKIVEATFQKNQFKVEGCSDQDSVCRINGHIPFGIAFGLPKTYLKSITISFRGRSYSLDVSDMYNAWGSRPLEYKGTVRYFGGKCFNGESCQVRGLFSDAAGTFVAEWRVVKGVAVRTVLTDSDDVVNLFIKNIDPPENE